MEESPEYMNYSYVAIAFAYITLFATIFPYSPFITLVSTFVIPKLEAFKIWLNFFLKMKLIFPFQNFFL